MDPCPEVGHVELGGVILSSYISSVALRELLSNAFMMMMMMREEHSQKSAAAAAAANPVTNDVPFIHPLRITSRVRQALRQADPFRVFLAAERSCLMFG